MPREVAADDGLWEEYCAWLEHRDVVGDHISALRHPRADHRYRPDPSHGWPPSTVRRRGDLDERLLVIALTWPVDVDESADLQSDAISAQLIRTNVGMRLVLVLKSVIDEIPRSDTITPDTIVRYMLDRAGVTRSHFDMLLAGQTAVDIATMMNICRSVGFSHDGIDWRMDDPQMLAARIQRHALLEILVENAEEAHLSAADVNTLIGQARRLAAARSAEQPGLKMPGPRDDAASALEIDSDPRVLHRHMKRGHHLGNGRYDREAFAMPPPSHLFRPLYDELISRTEERVTLSLAQILAIQSRTKRKNAHQGLREDARRDPAFWSNGSSKNRNQVRAWQAAGYSTGEKHLVADDNGEPDLASSFITFRALPGRKVWLQHRLNLSGWSPPSAPIHPWDKASTDGWITSATRVSHDPYGYFAALSSRGAPAER